MLTNVFFPIHYPDLSIHDRGIRLIFHKEDLGSKFHDNAVDGILEIAVGKDEKVGLEGHVDTS